MVQEKRRVGYSSRECRRGLTLLEVVVSLAIFLFSLAALSQLASMSGQRAVEVKNLGRAMLLCQSKLAELQAGAVELTSSDWTPVEGDPDWSWRVDCQQADAPGLWSVQVWVQRPRPDGTMLETSLSQMILDPAQRGSTLQSPGTTPPTTEAPPSSGTTGGTP